MGTEVFAFRFFDFFFEGGHFRSLFQRIHIDGLRAASDSRPCDIDCNISAADNDDVSVQRFASFKRDVFQEINAKDYAFRVFAFYAEFSARACADCKIESVKTFFFQFVQRSCTGSVSFSVVILG